MMLILAIANAVLWTGVITALLFVLMRQTRDIDAEIAAIEANLDSRTAE